MEGGWRWALVVVAAVWIIGAFAFHNAKWPISSAINLVLNISAAFGIGYGTGDLPWV